MTRFDLSSALAALSPGRPLVVVDADEVILGFLEGFESFLAAHDLYLDLTSYRLHGNVKRLEDRTAVLDVEVTALLDEFRHDLDSLDAVPGACEALAKLSRMASIVVLSNISEAHAPARRHNLLSLGLDYPLIANSGLKGSAVATLAARARATSFFVDDIPQHLASAAELTPAVQTVHLVGNPRLKGLLPIPFHANCVAADWAAAEAFITAHLT